MVDSAPELRLTTPSPETPSNVGRSPGRTWPRRRGSAPKNQPAATKAAHLPRPRSPRGREPDPADARRRRTRSGCGRSGVGQPAVVGAARSHQERGEHRPVRDRRLQQTRTTAARTPPRQGRTASGRPTRASPRSTRPTAAARGTASPRLARTHRGDAVGEPRQRPSSRGRTRRRATYAARPRTASDVASAPFTISQRAPATVDDVASAVADQDLPLERIDGQIESSPQERGEPGVDRAGTPRTPPRAPTPYGRASTPVRSRTGRGARPGRRWGCSVPSGCIQSTTLPRWAGASAGTSARAADSYARPATVRVAEQLASAAGRPRRPGRCRRRCRRPDRRCWSPRRTCRRRCACRSRRPAGPHTSTARRPGRSAWVRLWPAWAGGVTARGGSPGGRGWSAAPWAAAASGSRQQPRRPGSDSAAPPRSGRRVGSHFRAGPDRATPILASAIP